MAGLGKPWASLDAALFWLQILGLALIHALAIVVGATLAWALLIEPAHAWHQGHGVRIVTDAANWMHWGRVAFLTAGVLAAVFFALLAWYCDGMLRGSGKAEH